MISLTGIKGELVDRFYLSKAEEVWDWILVSVNPWSEVLINLERCECDVYDC